MRRLIIVFGFLLYTVPAVAQTWAVEQLNRSPRHHEWVEVQTKGRTVHSFVAYPERADSTPVVIVVHENRGLTDWVRSMADQLAGAGYLAVAPDLLSGFDAACSRTSDFESSDAARSALYELDAEQVQRDLQAVQEYTAKLPSSNGKTAVIGFCWGGSQTFRLATQASDLSAVLVFYGSPPAEDQIPYISTPVYGFYGENDQRINATIPRTEKLMAKHGKAYAYRIYEGAGHAFMRDGDSPNGSPANRKAKKAAWERVKQVLSHVQ